MTQNEYTEACLNVVYLAACAVKEEPPNADRVAGMDLANLFTAAQQHLLTGIVAIALERAGVKDDAFAQAKGKAIRKVMLFDAERTAVLDAFEEAGIWYIPLKGAILKDLYPKIGMRQMADNDILFDVSRDRDVRAIMERLGYQTERFDMSNHDIYHKPPVLNFEMHRCLFGAGHERQLCTYYTDVKFRLIKDEGNAFGYHFSADDFYIYLIAHEFKHYSGGGTGLRSLLDTYVYLTKKGDALNWAYIAEELDKLGLADYEPKNRSLALHLFSGEELTGEDREMLEYILSSGTYGTTKHSVENAVAKHGKIGYVFTRAFLPYHSMCTLYPILKKLPFLLPFCWVHRWIDALIHKRKKVAYQWKTAMKVGKKT
ncbi:MAG: nucleotidyltransferase family protein [Clostridia bacterium]|nr:nucleotidyltransferase family protein [Clostridia bacterium]